MIPEAAHEPYDWRDDAACKGTDPDLFFGSDVVPTRGMNARQLRLSQDTVQAKEICATCPVADLCLTEALDNDVQWGVWGGLSTLERKNLKRRLARKNGHNA